MQVADAFRKCLNQCGGTKEQGDDQGTCSVDSMHGVSPPHFIGFFLAAATPSVVLMQFFSDMGMGIQTIETLLKLEPIGNIMVSACFLTMFLLYIFDWSYFSRPIKWTSALLLVYALFAGGLLKIKSYPEGPLIIMLFQTPILLGVLRRTASKRVLKDHFYLSVSWVCLVVASAVIFIWICWIIGMFGETHHWNAETKNDLIERSSGVYEAWGVDYHLHCDPATKEDESKLDKKAKVARAKGCAKAKTTWYLLWICPLICSGVLCLISCCCYIRFIVLETDKKSSVEGGLKALMGVVAFLFMGMWVSASIAGASMQLAGTFMGFVYCGSLVAFVWIYLDIGKENLIAHSKESQIAQSIIKAASSDWAKALLVIMTNVLVPLFLLTSFINQRVRRCRGKSQSNTCYTDWVTRKIEAMREWNWASIFSKVHIIVILYFVLMVGVAKATYIFLSWLNVQLQQVDFELVCIIFFAIGYMMFMLPPVPGVPVYIFGGIILSARAKSTDLGEVGGILIATLLGYTLKLCAVAGQWSIGIFMGKSIRIQKMVGVDKVAIRAIEQILNRPGVSFAKIAILVGGPDWPTSVLCGILKLKCWKCVVGTMPCILVAAPCVLVGAFLLKAETSGFWGAIAGTTLVVATIGQSGAFLIAAYYTTEVVSSQGEELSKPRPEHKPLEEMAQAEAHFWQTYDNVTRWNNMPCFPKAVLSIGTTSALMSGFILVMADSACFRPFSLTSKISAPVEEGGLDDNPLEIILPGGYVAIGLFLLGCLLFKVFLRWGEVETNRRLKSSSPEFSDLKDDEPEELS